MILLNNIWRKSVVGMRYSRKTFMVNHFFAETSRDIELKMRQERAKNLDNKFKALSTNFGLKRPESVGNKYEKPSTYEFSVESLRKNSHMYPQYLLNELNNKKSQYYEVLQTLFSTLANADNKESIEFIDFIIKWNLYKRQDYIEMLSRKIFQMQLDLGQLFTLLKITYPIEQSKIKSLIISDLQNKILQKIINIDQHQYESLFKILNFMRINDLDPIMKRKEGEEGKESGESVDSQSFFKVVQGVLLRNINDVPLPNLVEMIVHYANNIKQSQDDRIQIMKKVQPKVIQNIQFFNHDELIAIIYSYVKTQTATEKLIQQFVKRVQLLYFQINWENKKKILNLASSLPFQKWEFIVGLSIFEIFKGKKVISRQGKIETNLQANEVQFQLLPSIYLSSYETNLITVQLVQKLQSKILQNMFNYDADDIGLIAWLFTITPLSMIPKKQVKDVLYTKLEAIIVGGFIKSSFSLKNISMVVWALCNSGGKSNMVYKQRAQFWKNIEFYIEQRISNKRQENILNGCCRILWAYLNNKPLTFKTLNAITNIIVQKQKNNQLEEELFNFELTTITSFYYSIRKQLPPSLFDYIEKICLKYFIKFVQEMNYLQILKMLKFILYDESDAIAINKLDDKTWKSIITQFEWDLKSIQYDYIMAVVNFTLISPEGKKGDVRVIQLVKKLMIKKKEQEQLKSVQR